MSAAGNENTKPTIVLIHGLWLTPRSWEGWIDRYQKAGYRVLAPKHAVAQRLSRAGRTGIHQDGPRYFT